MTTDGNFNVSNINTVKIPTVNSAFGSGALIPTSNGNGPVGLYLDDDFVYTIGQGYSSPYRSTIADPLNFVHFKNGQTDGFINNIYPSAIGNYFYSYGTSDDLGGYSSGSIYKAHINTPMSWYDTGVDSDAESTNAIMYVDGSNIYLIGGEGPGATYLNTIDVAAIGSPTTFTTSGSTLPAARIFGAFAVVGSNLYIYGGSANNSNSEDTIYTATTAAPTVWTVSGSVLPRPIHNSVAYVNATHVYIYGGSDSTGAVNLNSIYRATVGAPTTFTLDGSLPAILYKARIFTVGTYLYMIGISESGGTGVMRATVADPLTWTEIRQPSLATAQANTHIVIEGTKVYAFGGFNSAGALSNVIQSTNTVTPMLWSNEVSTLPAALGKGQLIKTSTNYYIIGGNGITGNDYKAAHATPTTWAADLSTGPTRTFGQAVIIEDEVFYLGGETAPGTPVTTGSRGVIENGSIVSWLHNPANIYVTIATPIALSRYVLIQAGDYIYALGGYTTGPALNYNIYRIQKNRIVTSSGYTGWINVGSILNPMVEATLAIINNTAYIIGGGTSTGFTTTDDYILSANMNDLANGNVIFVEENTALDSGLAGTQAMCVNDDLYLYGGRTSTNGTATIKRNMGWATHRFVLPKVPEATDSVPTIDMKTGTLGSYSSFQRTGMLPWLVTNK